MSIYVIDSSLPGRVYGAVEVLIIYQCITSSRRNSSSFFDRYPAATIKISVEDGLYSWGFSVPNVVVNNLPKGTNGAIGVKCCSFVWEVGDYKSSRLQFGANSF